MVKMPVLYVTAVACDLTDVSFTLSSSNYFNGMYKLHCYKDEGILSESSWFGTERY